MIVESFIENQQATGGGGGVIAAQKMPCMHLHWKKSHDRCVSAKTLKSEKGRVHSELVYMTV